MKGIIAFFLLSSFSVFGQTVYQAHEVEKQVEPTGGLQLLNHFVSYNLRIPFKSAVNGLNSKVYVKGVVEPDGSMSNLGIVKGIDSLCNEEAIRVLSLYKAWRPAVLKNATVRQTMVIPVTFNSTPIEAYDSKEQSLVNYFDNDWVISSVKEKQKYRRFIPVDDFGFINGDVSFQKIEGGTWSSIGSFQLTKSEFWKKVEEGGKADSILAFRISANYEIGNQPIYQSLQRDENGEILEFTEFAEDNRQVLEKSYFKNGALKEMTVYGKDVKQHIYWYENGQLSGIFESPQLYAKPYVRSVKQYYDKAGNHLVKDGNGYFVVGQSGAMGFDGNGEVKNGVKEGSWTAKTSDSTLIYQEHYNKGILTKGTSFHDGEKVEYTEVEIQPEFAGGMNSMYRYLAQNIKYPPDAAKKSIQGRVFTTFVVCEDGTLCDFEVLKGLDKSIDKEALRVIKGMSGKWEPGWQRGKKVRVKYNLPINFQLQ
jgi:TonB family protein